MINGSGISTTIANSGHTVKQVYTTNNELAFSGADTAISRIVPLYMATANLNGSRTLIRGNGTDLNYKTGELYVTVSKDENWTTGRGGTTEEYKDKEGHVVLKRTFNYTGTPLTLQRVSTYYVYDDLGNLSYVLTPGSNADGGIPTGTVLNNLCYWYRYDERNRLTQKKIPGKGWEFTVYNQLDQPVLTQDSTQRTINQWTATKYDALGRLIVTGLWNAGSAKALNTLQDSIYANAQWDNRDNNITVNPTPGYNLTSYPKLNKALQIRYYDDYLFPAKPFNSAVAGTLNNPIGLLTASRTMVLNTVNNSAPAMMWAVHYYDDRGRKVQTTERHYLGDTLSASNYDLETIRYNFNDQVTARQKRHFTASSATVPSLVIRKEYIYDHVGRKLKTWEQLVNGGQTADTRTLLSQVDYNEIGQLWKKHLHSTDSVNFRQNITYAYNERGWLRTSTAELFAEELRYNTGVTKFYNGNIAYQFWGLPGNLNKHYTYLYDQLNRLTSGNSTISSGTLANDENSITYDNMGNITALKRFRTNTLIDQLTYTYHTNSTRLLSVNDATSNDLGLKHGLTTYAYDGNGNLTQDNGKGINNPITYNLLNLPQTITDKNMTYTYDAMGQKLNRIIGADRTDYIGDIQYDHDTISFIRTEEGRALPKDSASYNYEYTLADHLGNSRVNFDSNGPAAVPLQVDDYYPFGMEINSLPNGTKNEYLYNNKELQENLGWYDYGARFYDPVIARWTGVDPLAEKARRWSPYTYGKNNPIIIVDPDGMFDLYFADRTDDHTGVDEVKKLLNEGLGGNFANIDELGKVTLNVSDEQLKAFTDEQKGFYDVINSAVQADGIIGVDIVKNSSDAEIANYSQGAIDIEDVKQFGNNEGADKFSVFGHEVAEQMSKQLGYSKNYPEAHEIGLEAEGKIKGNTRVNVEETNAMSLLIPGNEGRNGFFINMFKDNKTGKITVVKIDLKEGNVIRVTSTPKIK